MESVFKKHNVHHLSPSTINLWISQPALCLLKIAGLTDNEAGPSAWRGSAADRAITKAVFEPDATHDELVDHALSVFDDYQIKASNEHDADKIVKERDNISKYVEVGTKFYRAIDETPVEEQGRVRVNIGDIDVPFVGFFDLLYYDKVRDTKTVGRAVSSLTNAASRQGSLYALATRREAWIDYVTPKEVLSYKIPNPEFHIRQMEKAANGLKTVLSHSDDIIECCQLVYPDLDHWMWSETMKNIAKDVWQMEMQNEI